MLPVVVYCHWMLAVRFWISSSTVAWRKERVAMTWLPLKNSECETPLAHAVVRGGGSASREAQACSEQPASKVSVRRSGNRIPVVHVEVPCLWSPFSAYPHFIRPGSGPILVHLAHGQPLPSYRLQKSSLPMQSQRRRISPTRTSKPARLAGRKLLRHRAVTPGVQFDLAEDNGHSERMVSESSRRIGERWAPRRRTKTIRALPSHLSNE